MRLEVVEGKIAGQVQYSLHLALQMQWGRKELGSLDTPLSPFQAWPIPTPLLQSCGHLHGATMLVQGHNFQTLASAVSRAFGVLIPDISMCLRPLCKPFTGEPGLGWSH